jgi:hypothetical protein
MINPAPRAASWLLQELAIMNKKTYRKARKDETYQVAVARFPSEGGQTF